MKSLNPISLLAFLIVLYVARNAVPYAAYPLIILLIPFTLYQFLNINAAKRALGKSITLFSPIILLIIIELIALFGTVFPFQDRALDIVKDIAFIAIFLFLLAYHIQSKDNFQKLLEQMSKYFILFSIIISVVGIWKFFYTPSFFSYNQINGEKYFRWGTTLMMDYNYFSLFLFNGLVFGLYQILKYPEKIKRKTFFLILLQIIILAGLFSGSRRFIICFIALIMICLLLLIPYLYKKVFTNTVSYKYFNLFLGLTLLNLGLAFTFLSYFPKISATTEKILFINSRNVNTNVICVSNRINSVASFPLIKVHTDNQILAEIIENKEIVPLTSSRQKLWDLGKEIYHDYSISKKILGNGFAFFEIFKNETTQFLYPHHLFLSVLLFSGIIGLIIYIAILSLASMIYLYHLKKLEVLFVLFIFNFTFGFFSFTDFFGATFYSILIILPLLYAYLYGYQNFFKEINRKIKK
jgi:hypothetical protein